MKSLLLKLYFIFLPLIIVALLVLQYFYKFSTFFVLIPIVVFLLEYSYRHFSSVYFFTNKILNKIINPSTRWSISVEYKISLSQDPEALLVMVAKDILSFDDARVWASKEGSKIFQLKNFICEISIHQEILAEGSVGKSFIFNISISKLEAPYRSADNILSNDIVPLLDKVRGSLNPLRNKFVFTSKGKSLNPYYGLLLQKVDILNIKRFNVEFTEKAEGNCNNDIQIHKDKIIVVSNNLIAFQNIVRKYLILSLKI